MTDIHGFNGRIDKVFLIAKPACRGEGEDSFYCCRNAKRAIAAVFDGCGGLGSRRYETFKGHTGAYISARTASGTAHDCFHIIGRQADRSCKAFYQEYTKQLLRAFTKVSKKCAHEKSLIRGSLTRDFPCTAAIAYVSVKNGNAIVDCLWAGDSRVYMLTKKGLLQMTVDDLDIVDAMENLKADGALKNVLSSDGQYTIHRKTIKRSGPALIFAATDGCFGYFESPMEFEYALVSCIVESETPVIFEKNLHDVFELHAQDDFTFGGIAFGFDDFGNMKRYFEERLEQLKKENIVPIQKAGDPIAVRKRLWENYRDRYEHFMKGHNGS